MLFDVIIRKKTYPLVFYFGSLPIILSLIFIGFLIKNDDSDPLLRFFKIIYRKLCNCRRTNIVR